MPHELELPQRDTSPRTAFPGGAPRRFRCWIADIGRQEPPEAARRLLDGLATLNRLALPPRRRLRLLEAVRATARAPLDGLVARVQAHSPPLPERTRPLAALSRELLKALLLGYEIALVESTQAGVRVRRRRIALAAERAMAARAELLLRHVEAEEPLPASFWRRAYAVHGRAEAVGAVWRRVADDQLARLRRRRQSPGEAFIRLLLLGLARPRGLRRGEAERIHNATERWCRRARLADADAVPADAAERGSVFAVALDGAAPPVQWRQCADHAAEHTRALDIGPIVAEVERLHARVDAAGSASDPVAGDDGAIGATALKRLLDNWNPRPLRAPEQGAGRAPAEVTVSLGAIHDRLLAQDRRAAGGRARARQPSRYTHLPALALQTIAPEDDDDERSAGPRTGYPHAHAAPERRPAAPADADALPDWAVEDDEASGFRLRWHGEGKSGATVGELVGLRPADAGGWRVGVVRWLQFVDDERYEIGCDLLSARPAAAAVRHEPTDRHRRTRAREPGEPALLLPGAGAGRDAAVLVRSYQFSEGAIVELEVGERTLRVRLTAEQEQSTYFTLFGLAPAPTRGRTSGMPEAAAGRTTAG